MPAGRFNGGPAVAYPPSTPTLSPWGFGPKLIADALDAPSHLIWVELAADRDRLEPPVASRIAEV